MSENSDKHNFKPMSAFEHILFNASNRHAFQRPFKSAGRVVVCRCSDCVSDSSDHHLDCLVQVGPICMHHSFVNMILAPSK